ncbi:MAG: hypothetical protein U0269_35725 [Polyangiales bacterium]
MGSALAVLVAASCGPGRPDVADFEPILEEDGNLVTLLNEAMDLGERDPRAAARNLQEQVTPRARRNAEAAGNLSVQHPRARELRTRLCQLSARRAETTQALGEALSTANTSLLSTTMRAMRQLALDMHALEGDVQRARNDPGRAGCSR